LSKGIFITATGTNIGKTFVTALIIKKLRQNGFNAGYYKAALSGAEWLDGKLVAVDSDYVCRVSRMENEPNSLVSYIYETAVSPHLAAQIEGRPIDMNVLLSDFEKSKSSFDFIAVEGSGGIVCPLRLDDKIIMLTDVIKAFDLDVILVASAALGTINSVVLTVEYAKQYNIVIKGIIINGYEADNFLHIDNKNQIEYLTGIPVITSVSQNADNLEIDVWELASLFREV